MTYFKIFSICCLLVATAGGLRADDRVTAVRERLIRRQICDLRRELSFVENQIKCVPEEFHRTIILLRNNGTTPKLENQVADIYSEREKRLCQRLEHATRLLTAAELRLSRITVIPDEDDNLLSPGCDTCNSKTANFKQDMP